MVRKRRDPYLLRRLRQIVQMVLLALFVFLLVKGLFGRVLGSWIPVTVLAAVTAVLTLVLGRVWCGWMCPYHLMADLTAWLRTSFRKRILGKSDWEAPTVPTPFKANVIRYGFLLVGTLAAGAIGIPILNYVSAPGILSTEAMILVRQGTLSLEFGFIAIILLLELFLFPRFWCRLFCPS